MIFTTINDIMKVPYAKKKTELFKVSVFSPLSPVIDIIFLGKNEKISPKPILFYIALKYNMSLPKGLELRKLYWSDMMTWVVALSRRNEEHGAYLADFCRAM